MSEVYLLSLVTRAVAVLGFVLAACVLWRARGLDGPVVNAFTWAWLAATATMVWSLVASVLYATGHRTWPWSLAWEWAWVVWAPGVGAAWHLVRVLRRALPWGGR